MSSPLHDLNALGQSVWLDSISRDMLQLGDLKRLLTERAVVGVTSNPTIFAQAISTSALYDADIAIGLEQGLNARTIFEHLEIRDIQGACDTLHDVYEQSEHLDGVVSIELEPDLAHDTGASLARARQLWQLVDRPNLMIKVPATEEGLPVIEELIYEGINVNVTLLFSVLVYRAVMERYLRALERRQTESLPLDVSSVASFFVSRVDTAVDPKLHEHGDASAHLVGRVAVGNAHLAFEAHQEVFDSDRFAALREEGARPQRPLWASTGTKNPSYSDILYVQELIAPGTVNTMPMATLDAFADHGEAVVTISDASWAHELLGQLSEFGVDLGDVTEQLRRDGVAAFQRSYDELLADIESKAAALSA